ncbi:MAG: motility protein A [Myxococcota bacterium]
MDLATILGIVLGLGLIAGSIMLDGSIMAFVNAPGMLVVVGGTIAATLINQKFKVVLGAMSVAMNAVFDRGVPIQELVDTIQEMTQKARKDGLLGLEEIEVRDPFLSRGTVMAIDGMDRDFIVSTMQRELAEIKARHQRGQQIFRFMASTAPAMGMIGTLIGLVNMLQSLDDPSSIGPAMAVALLTTFYGAVLAFLIFGPIADKLEARTREEIFRGNLAIAGIESVVDSDNKVKTQTKIAAFLAPRERNQESE